MLDFALRAIACLTLVALGVPEQARAVNIIDQNAPHATSFIAGFNKADLAQSFRQSATNISGAGILLHPRVGDTGFVSISLWTALPDESGARQLVTGLVAAVAGQWADIFWEPVDVDPAKSYFLQFTGTPTLGIAGTSLTEHGYPHGLAFANPGYLPYVTYDYAFRTYAFIPEPPTPPAAEDEPAPSEPAPQGPLIPAGNMSPLIDAVSISAAPDSATWLTMLCGFGLAGSALRRRRSTGFRACHT